jgi:hypothetical protein
MAAPVQYKWVTPAAPRASRIAPEKWNEYEVELRALYESNTLEQVMKMMGDKYKFWPS